MAEQGNDKSNLMLPGGSALMIAAVLGYFVVADPALEGSRPHHNAYETEQAHGGEDVQARLWQDPFAAVIKHKNANKSSGKLAAALVVKNVKSKIAGDSESVRVEFVMPTGESSVDPRHSLTKLKAEISSAGSGITVLGVMVFGGPYGEEAEMRLRRRYALVSALGVAGYAAKDSDHIGYVTGLNQENNKDNLPNTIPYEWFEPVGEAGSRGEVLVLWLDDSSFGLRPLKKLGSLTEKIGLPGESFTLLGPAGSTTLKAMIRELQRKRQSNPMSG